MSNREPLRPKLRREAMTLGVVILGAAADSFAENEFPVKVMGSRGMSPTTARLCEAQNAEPLEHGHFANEAGRAPLRAIASPVQAQTRRFYEKRTS